MNRMPWWPFYTADWIKGTRRLSPIEKATWIDLLVYMWEAPERGKLITDWEEIARMTGIPYLDAATTIDALKRKEMLSVTECDGLVTLMSRRMFREEKLRESARLRKKESRSRLSHKNVTDNTQKSEVIKDKDSSSTDVDGSFVSFWKAYPKKVGKGAAEKAYAKSCKLVPYSVILASVMVQVRSEAWLKDGGQFIPNPATWLNQRRWEDELKPVANLPNHDPAKVELKRAEIELRMEKEWLKREIK